MPQKHRNQTVPVYAPWDGVREVAKYFETPERARRLVEAHRAILRHKKDSNGFDLGIEQAGIEQIARSGNLKDCARTETHAIRETHIERAAKKRGAEVEDVKAEGSLFHLAQYFRSLSPYTWARSGR